MKDIIKLKENMVNFNVSCAMDGVTLRVATWLLLRPAVDVSFTSRDTVSTLKRRRLRCHVCHRRPHAHGTNAGR